MFRKMVTYNSKNYANTLGSGLTKMLISELKVTILGYLKLMVTLGLIITLLSSTSDLQPNTTLSGQSQSRSIAN